MVLVIKLGVENLFISLLENDIILLNRTSLTVFAKFAATLDAKNPQPIAAARLPAAHSSIIAPFLPTSPISILPEETD